MEEGQVAVESETDALVEPLDNDDNNEIVNFEEI